MAIEVVIPTVGESVATVFIARWIAKEGDTIAAGQPVLEIDSDKASMEVPAPAGGVMSKPLFEAGAEVAIGAVVAYLTEGGAAAAAAPASAPEVAERRKRGVTDVALVRVEELYPYPRAAIQAEVDRYPDAEVVWCQEEP
ncbi:hypothetical protein L6R49_23095, partial [Myxococcota bacterium]|nr:hypothetical protein [Myxococcota bacterium]